MKTTKLLSGLMAFAILFSACNNEGGGATTGEKTPGKDGVSTGQWSGKIITEYAGDIRYYNFDTKEELTVYRSAGKPSVTQNGDVVTLSAKFPKTNMLLQIADPEFNNVSPLLDLSEGWFGGGIYGARISPDGQRIAVTITSYASGDYKIKKDGVYVFDKAGTVIAQFENKYQADWMPDGRLVMAGSLLQVSSDASVKTSGEPGIYISDKALGSVQRVDPGFNDPPPYNVAVSPDGQSIAFVKNNHVWVMNADGSNVHQLTAAAGDNAESFPVWSPDGKFIACWSYKSFEKSYYTALAIVPANAATPVKLTNEAGVWARDKEGSRVSGGSQQLVWLKG